MSDVQQLVNRMRAQADFLAKHEEVVERFGYTAQSEGIDQDLDSSSRQEAMEGLTYVSVYSAYSLEFTVTGPDARHVIRSLAREFGGRFEKSYYSSSFVLSQSDDPLIVRISTDRDAVCMSKVVGQKEVTVPAVEAKPARTEFVNEVEWDCGTLLEGLEAVQS